MTGKDLYEAMRRGAEQFSQSDWEKIRRYEATLNSGD